VKLGSEVQRFRVTKVQRFISLRLLTFFYKERMKLGSELQRYKGAKVLSSVPLQLCPFEPF